MNDNKKTSVIIVGAGPVGLGLACDLGQRGVDCVLIEKRDGAINVPKQSMVRPSGAARSNTWLVAVLPPAPGMFCTRIVGLPGMCLRR